VFALQKNGTFCVLSQLETGRLDSIADKGFSMRKPSTPWWIFFCPNQAAMHVIAWLLLVLLAGSTTLCAMDVSPVPPRTPSRREIVFIDKAVADFDVLAAAVQPGVETVLLDPAGDELAQMALALRGRRGICANLQFRKILSL